tara:strand:+ start:177 stop:644 length:468 start_codon:yes stop_codon:yes gene_type:complete
MYTKGTQRPTEVIGRNTSFYSIYTLIDVTDANVSSPKTDVKKFYQSQNLNTFMQVIGLRTQPVISSITKLESQSMTDYNFGNDFTGSHTIWILRFVSETDGAWNKDNNETTLLAEDFNFVPVYDGIDETATINGDIINTDNEDKLNTYFIFSENI